MTFEKKISFLCLPLIGMLCGLSSLAFDFSQETKHRADIIMRKEQEIDETKYPKVDPAAWKLMNDSRKTRYYFNEHFAGFTCDINVNDKGKWYRGKVEYDLTDGAVIKYENFPEHEEWATIMVANMVSHRRQLRFEDGDGKNPITFGPEDNSPLGRLILLNDKRQSSYRVRDGRVTQVRRREGEERFIITVLDEVLTERGAYLPRYFVVDYFDKSGKLKRSEKFSDRYRQTQSVWFPESRECIITEAGKDDVITRIIQFGEPRIKFK